MRDIRINKKINTNKTPEKRVVQVQKYEPAEVEITSTKKSVSTFSVILFGFMTTSVICYIFMISASVFYSVKASQYDYKSESLTGTYLNEKLSDEFATKIISDRVSYINQDSDTSISLK